MSAQMLDVVPDFIREAALQGHVDNPTISKDESLKLGSMPLNIKKAFSSGDINTINRFHDQTKKDLDPIYANIKEQAEKAFSTVHNASDNRSYQIAISGSPENPQGYMWCYCPDMSVEHEPRVQPVAQVGLYSVNTGWLGISTVIWTNKWFDMGASLLSLVLSGLVARFLQNRIFGMLVTAAAQAAATATGQALVAAGVISSAFWAAVASAAVGLVVFVVIGAISYFLLAFIADFIYRNYWIEVNIYNWDPDRDYLVYDYYLDNANFSGGQQFEPIRIPKPSNIFRRPDGIPQPTKDTIYQSAIFIMENKNKVFQGLGAAFSISSMDKEGEFQIKYECPRFRGNRVGIRGSATSEGAEKYYNDVNSWAPEGSFSAKSILPGSNVPILCTTTALSGRSDRFYQLDVHIGLSPTSTFNESQDQELATQTPLRPEPELPGMLQPNDEIPLPEGHITKVLG